MERRGARCQLLSHPVCPNIQTNSHLFHHPASHSHSSLLSLLLTRYVSISRHRASLSHFRPRNTTVNFHPSLPVYLYERRYLCVGLVVLAVVGGGVGAVLGGGRGRRRAVGEGGGALGDDGSYRAAVHPGAARLPSVDFPPR